MRKSLATLAILFASISSAYTNTVLVSTNTRAATEKWVSVRFEATLPSTPTNPASKYLNGNREWSSISLGHPQLSDINGDVNYQHITTGQVAKLDHISDSGILRVHDTAQPSRYFMEVVNSTGTVYAVTGPFTNLMVTLSDDFEEVVTHTRPSWTNNVFPFTDGEWIGYVYADYQFFVVNTSQNIYWESEGLSIPSYLPPFSAGAVGTATVSIASIYYTTNVFAHFTTEAEIEAAKAACGVVLTNTVASATNALMPYARTVYGDLSTTNEAGYAAFNATSAAASSYSAIIPTSFIGSNTNTVRYRFNSLRKFGVLTNTAWFVKSGFGAGIKSVSTRVSVKDASGNVISQSSSQPVYLSDSSSPSSVTNIFTMPDNVYSGTVDVACIAVSTNASFSVRMYSGAQYTNLLTFSEAPTAYATHAELRSLRAEIPAIVMSNSVPQTIVRSVSVSSTNILVSSTNSVYYVALTNAANVGFDFSALALGGTKRADITAVIDCLNTQALYSVINTNLVAMDCQWEPTVTGRYELAVSSDGVRTKVVQNIPSMCFFAPALIAVGDSGTTYGALSTALMSPGTLSREITIANENNPRELAFLRLAMTFNSPEVDGHLSFVCGSAIISEFAEWSSVTNSVYAYPSWANGYRPAYIPMRPAAAVSGFAFPTRLVRVIKDVDDSRGTWITSATIRRMNALERAAYNAGAYPAAFRLDY